MTLRHVAPLVAIASLAVAIAIPASAQSPAGEPCEAPIVTDPAGDAVRNIGPTGNPKAGPQMDIRSLHLTFRDGKLYSRITLENLSKTLAQGSSEATWYTVWNVGAETKYVAANNTAGEITYEFGTYAGNQYTPGGDTKGSIKEGPMGYFDVEIPKALGAEEGKKLTAVHAASYEVLRSPVGGPGLLVDNDTAPDGAGPADSPKSYTVTACATGGTPTPTATPGPGETPTPGSTPAPGGTATPAPSSTPGPGGGQTGGTPAGPLKVTATTRKLSARKAKRRAAVKLRSAEPVTNLRALLYTGVITKPKRFAEGSLKSLNGAGTLTLKVKKKLKKGKYKLFLQGTRSGGQQGTAEFKVTVTK